MNELMEHLRDNGIKIEQEEERLLKNIGYFHGYKGYRFFNHSSHKLPFLSFDEIYATVQYDTKLKGLLYEKVMFIETAVKNYSLECILTITGSEDLQSFFEKAVLGYKNAPKNASEIEKKKYQKSKLNLQSTIQSYLSKAYDNGNPKITHFYNNINCNGVPLWALVEIMVLGDFAKLISCLTLDARNKISNSLGISDVSIDSNRSLVYKYLYAIKDLRNAIAHNSPVFDTRFRKVDPSNIMKQNLVNEIKVPYVNFKTIGDYVILICYYLKNLEVPKSEIELFVLEFEKIIDDYKRVVSTDVSSKVIHPDTYMRMEILKKYISD